MPRKVLAKKREPWEVNFDNPFNMKGTPIPSSNYGMGRNDDWFKLNQFQGMLPDFNIKGNNTEGRWKDLNTTSVRQATFWKGKGGGMSTNNGQNSVNINQKTLEKGMGTIMGMSPQVRDFTKNDGTSVTYLAQGFNYANPSYTNAVELAKGGGGGVGKSKIQQMADNSKKVDAILNARELSTSTMDWINKINPDGAESFIDEAIQNQKDAVYDEPDDIPEENLSDRVYLTPQTSMKNKSLNKLASMRASLTSDPTIIRANQIQSELGRTPITNITWRRRQGRWGSKLSDDPKRIIEDYNEKSSLINWAKTVNPDETKLDPTRTVRVMDKQSGYTATRYWTHNNNRRAVGTYWVNTSTYKQALVSDVSTQGDKMDMLYDKINTSAKKKKAKYSTFFKPDDEVQSYQYYSLTDSDFDQFGSYKTNLVKNVRATNKATYDVKEKMGGSYKYDASSKLDDNAPKQKYLKYQKTGEDSFIKPTVQGLKSQISTIDRDVIPYQEKISKHKSVISNSLDKLSTNYLVGNLESQIAKDLPKSIGGKGGATGNEWKYREKIQNNKNEIKKIKELNLSNTMENLDRFEKNQWGTQAISDIRASKIGMDQASNKIATIRADVGYRETENQNINNAITFVEGKSKNLLISGKSVASRDNLGRITISDKPAYQKYIKDTPKEYLKQADTLDSSLIPDLEETNITKSEKYSDMEKEYYRKQRAKAQFGTTRPKRSNIRNARRRK